MTLYLRSYFVTFMFFQIKSFLKFLWQSKNEHGVHSPFVFDLVTKCFYDKESKPAYKVLTDYRNSLLANTITIEVTDFGSGSKVFKSNTRPISKIAKTAGITGKRAELLFRITNYLQPSTILEIGTSLGLATSALALGAAKASITTLEGCPETAKIAQLQLAKLSSRAQSRDKFNNVELIVTEFSKYFKTQHSTPKTHDLIYFDGNHSKTATLDYFELLLHTSTNESVWIFDDIHWSAGMEDAWKIIKNNPKVTVTIDTFQWGLVFFRREQEKEHFVIRV